MTIESIDFTNSSCLAWQTINKLTGKTTKLKSYPITVDSITAQPISNSRFSDADKAFTRKTTSNLNNLCQAPSADANLSFKRGFQPQGDCIDYQTLEARKSSRDENIHPKFIPQQGSNATEWLRSFCAVCFCSFKLPKV